MGGGSLLNYSNTPTYISCGVCSGFPSKYEKYFFIGNVGFGLCVFVHNNAYKLEVAYEKVEDGRWQ